MLALIGTLFPTIAGWINLLIGYFQAQAAAQTAATNAEGTAETQHETDGAQSVADQQSTDAQNTGLDAIQQGLENPTPVVVTLPKGNGQ